MPHSVTSTFLFKVLVIIKFCPNNDIYHTDRDGKNTIVPFRIMGAASNISTNQISLQLFRFLCGDDFHEEIFDSCKDSNGLISAEKLSEMIYFKENITNCEDVFHFFGKDYT